MTHRLYHYPMACSTACRLAAAEFGIPLEIARADVFTKSLAGGGSLFAINPLGLVATLECFDGQVLTENTAILLWLQAHGPGLPVISDPDFFTLLRWTAFCATELHKGLLWPLLRGDVDGYHKAFVRDRAGSRLDLLEQHMSDRDGLVGAWVTAADAYLAWFLVMAPLAGLDLASRPALLRVGESLLARPGWRAVIDDDMAALRDDLAVKGARPFADRATEPV
ncbi:hypothetical protein [uncultured Maricaulis sp.]|uniref:glutathione S-transferase family protein n=1 Tax=uncultured Maricaulis sp. TaxID=174710 RepID=UPI00260BD84A|nr:hypothetical protein [uncultured Maricaulis sp.]